MPDRFLVLIRDSVRFLVALAVAHQFVVLFLVLAIEEAGVPLPAPGDLVVAAYADRARGDLLAVATVVLICALASTAGTLIPYLVARRLGPPTAHRIARWFDVDPGRVDTWIERVKGRGFLVIFVGRLIPGLRVAMSLVAGAAQLPIREFSPAVFCAAAIYWSGWATLGVILGPTFRHIVGPAYLNYVLVLLPVIFGGYLVFRLLRGRQRQAALLRADLATQPL